MYTILHAVAGYFVLLGVVRILSRRPGAQFTPFEFVIVFLIGGVIIAATVGDDRSVTNCICAIIAIGLMHRLTAGLRARVSTLGAAVDGVPLVLLNRGRWHTEAMKGMRLGDQDIMSAARSKGLRDLTRVRYAVLERVGSVSILKEDEPEKPATRPQPAQEQKEDTPSPDQASQGFPPEH